MNNPHEIKTVRCAHCGTVRREANHWFAILVAGDQFRCSPLAALATRQRGQTKPADLPRGLRRDEAPACGQQCAQKIFEKFLAREGITCSRGSLGR